MVAPLRIKEQRPIAAGLVDDLDTWRDRRGYALSDRIWRNKQVVRQQIDQTLRRGLAEGWTSKRTARELRQYVDPSDGGKAKAGAERLAVTEMSRANALATQQVARADPAVRFLHYETASGHIVADECSDLAGRDSGHGAGVYPVEDCPLPPRHPRCRCITEMVRDPIDLTGYAKQLRVEYGLDEEPDDLSPADLAEYRRQTRALRDQVLLMWRGWFEQTGLVTEAQLAPSGGRVRDWIALVRQWKRGQA